MKFTLKKILLLAAAVLALVAFIMMFVTQVELTLLGGWNARPFNETLFGDNHFKGAVLPFIGYLLILLAGVCPLVLAFLGKEKRLFTIIAMALVLVGVIFVFVTKAAFCGANDITADVYRLGAGPIIGGILGILCLGCLGCAEFLPAAK